MSKKISGVFSSLPGVSQPDFGILSQREKFFFSFITVFQPPNLLLGVTKRKSPSPSKSLSGFSVV
ncbi:hypothetical protein [Syntrophus aciditrophicus]|uniref:hypothetical protein n=1 Tax=Syntrophus aciditrophicus TaxID=316277 RepID=UPI001F22F937|nr:hypothetical protein [Syntrophus aciditrophicus]